MDTNQHKIAQTLRSISKSIWDWSGIDVRWYISRAVFGDTKVRSNNELLKELANLIEPSIECPYYHDDRHYCLAHEDMLAADRDALLELADEMDSHWLGYEGMEDSPVAQWSRRIREALGVER